MCKVNGSNDVIMVSVGKIIYIVNTLRPKEYTRHQKHIKNKVMKILKNSKKHIKRTENRNKQLNSLKSIFKSYENGLVVLTILD